MTTWLIDKSALVRLAASPDADRGQHRAPSVPDLIIAATAELAELTILHCYKDFDLIASVTGQPTEWLNAT